MTDNPILYKVLKDFGLNGREIGIYLYLLEKGTSTPPQIAKSTNIARTNCYNILQELQNKGLVKRQKAGKRFSYIAIDPEIFLALLEEKKKMIAHIIPDLKAVEKTQKNKPVIKFFDGIEQIKIVFSNTLEAKSILGIASTEKLFSLDEKYFNKYEREIKKRKIFFKDIVTPSSGKNAASISKDRMGVYYDYKVIPKNYKEILTDILIWDDNVALLTLENPIFGTIIKNKDLALTLRTMFEVMWRSLPSTNN